MCTQTSFTQGTLVLPQAPPSLGLSLGGGDSKGGRASLSPAQGPCWAKHPHVFYHRVSWVPWDVDTAVIPVFRWESEAQRDAVTCLRSYRVDQNLLLDLRDGLVTPDSGVGVTHVGLGCEQNSFGS